MSISDFSIITVNAENVDELGFFCVKNKKHPSYVAKFSWLRQRFNEGLRIKLVMTKEGKQAGFIEYTPGEYTWRVVHAPDYLVIHCLWIISNKFSNRGMASALLQKCCEAAQEGKKAGVAVISSDGPWMANKAVFLKNGFELVDEAPPHFQLLVKRIGKGPTPEFPKNWEERLGQFKELQLIYTYQCPYIDKAIAELPSVAEQHGITLKLTESTDPAQARKIMPSPYGVICLGYQGRLLADHPISATRFRNILQKDLGLQPTDRL